MTDTLASLVSSLAMCWDCLKDGCCRGGVVGSTNTGGPSPPQQQSTAIESNHPWRRCCSVVALAYTITMYCLDVTNVVLDYSLTIRLARDGHTGMAAAMGVAVTFGLVIHCCGAAWQVVATMYNQDPYLDVKFFLFLLTEVTLYVVEDTTTIFIYSRLLEVEENSAYFDPNSAWDLVNLFTSMVSGIILFVTSVATAVYAFWRRRAGNARPDSYDNDNSLWREDTFCCCCSGTTMLKMTCIIPLLPTAYFSFLAIGIMFLPGTTTSQPFEVVTLVVYVLSMLSAPVLFCFIGFVGSSVTDDD